MTSRTGGFFVWRQILLRREVNIMSVDREKPDAWTIEMTERILNSGMPEYYIDTRTIDSESDSSRGRKRMGEYLDAIKEGIPVPGEGVDYPPSHAYNYGKPTAAGQ
jgi:hypothetical protein